MVQSVTHILSTLTPIYAILILGALLRHIGFISAELAKGLNKLIFNIALPCLITASIAAAPIAPGWERSTLALMSATISIFAISWLIAPIIGISKFSRPAFVQAVFRSNNAYIGLPVMQFAFTGRADLTEMLSLAMLTLAPCLILYNVLAVAILTKTDKNGSLAKQSVNLLKGIAKNPLIIGCIIGLVGLLLRVKYDMTAPTALAKTITTLGAMATPGSILALGAALTPAILRANISGAHWTVLLKLVVTPLLGLAFAMLLNLPPIHRFVVLCYLACPSAVASFIMAQAMGGDADIAGSSVALTTIYSFISLAAVLLWAMPG